MTRTVRKTGPAAALALVMLLCALAAGAGQAQAQSGGYRFQGTVTGAGGAAAAQGTLIEARIGERPAGTTLVGSDGRYLMVVDFMESPPAATTVRFLADGRYAGEGSYQGSGPDYPPQTLDLSLSGAATGTPAAGTPTPGKPAPTPEQAGEPRPTATGAERAVQRVDGFEIPPEVALRPIVDEIHGDSDGVIEAWMYNSGLNKVNLVVEIVLSVPSGLHVTGGGGSFTSGGGRGVGKYYVEPGQGRTVTFGVQPGLPGDFTIESVSRYWPEGNEELWTEAGLSHPLKVTGTSGRSRVREISEPPTPVPAPPTGGGCSLGSAPDGGSAANGGANLGMAPIALAMLGMLGWRATRRGKGGPRRTGE